MKYVAFDTNLLVLLLVGRASPAMIGRHKRLRAFGLRDFAVLVDILGASDSLVVVPQSIAEVSNLAVQGISEPLRGEILRGLRSLVHGSIEKDVASASAVDQAEYLRLGVTDAAWLVALGRDVTFVTQDADLFLAALSKGYAAIRFADLRG